MLFIVIAHVSTVPVFLPPADFFVAQHCGVLPVRYIVNGVEKIFILSLYVPFPFSCLLLSCMAAVGRRAGWN